MVSTATYATQSNGYDQQSYTGNYWPTVGQWPHHHHHPDFLSQDVSFAGTAALEASTVTQTPSSHGKDLFSSEI